MSSDSDEGYQSDSFLSEGDTFGDMDANSVDLNSLTVLQLKEKMKSLGQKNYSRLKKPQLVEKLKALLGSDKSPDSSPEAKSISKQLNGSDSSVSSETVTGTKRRVPDWNVSSKKRQKISNTSITKPKKKTPTSKVISPVKSSTDSLALAFSSDEDLSDGEPSLKITKKVSAVVTAISPSLKPSKPLPDLTNQWNKRKRPSDTPGLLDTRPDISTHSETDLLDTLRGDCAPAKSKKKSTMLPDEGDSFLMDLSDASVDDLPKSPVLKTAHSISFGLAKNLPESSGSDDDSFVFTPKKPSKKAQSRKIITESPEENNGTQILEDSPVGGTLPFDDSPIQKNTIEKGKKEPKKFVFDLSPIDKGGTQVIEDSPAGGTLPLDDSPSGDQSPFGASGTQLLDGEESEGEGDTQMLPGSPLGTQILESSPKEGTQVLDQPSRDGGTLPFDDSDLFDESEKFLESPKKKGTNALFETSPRSNDGGTLAIESSDDEPTLLLPSQGNDKSESSPTGTLVVSQEDSHFIGFGPPTDNNITSPTLPTDLLESEFVESAADKRRKFLEKERLKRKKILDSPTIQSPEKDLDAKKKRELYQKKMNERRKKASSPELKDTSISPPVRADSESILQPEPFEFNPPGTLVMSDTEDTSAMLLMHSPDVTTRANRPRPSAIPLTPPPGDAPDQCTPTIRILEGETPNFRYHPPNSNHSLGRLVPIYSFRSIIPLQSSVIILGSDKSCTYSFLYDAASVQNIAKSTPTRILWL